MTALSYPSHPKDRGQWAELLFMATAARLGLKIAHPYGDNARYDVIVEAAGQLHRVQIKCTTDRRGRGFPTKCSWARANPVLVRRPEPDAPARPEMRTASGQTKPVFRRKRYSKRDVDFIAAYIIPDDSWFIIPIELIQGTWLSLPAKEGSRRLRRWEQFREAWHLLGASSASGLPLDGADSAVVSGCRAAEGVT